MSKGSSDFSMIDVLDSASWGAIWDAVSADMQQPTFWLGVLQIIWINILLSGDNAVVIALACRDLPPRQRMWGMIIGAGVAVTLRILFTLIVTTLMQLPYLKLVGGAALVYIAVKLLVPEDEQGDAKIEPSQHLWRAVRIVALADIIMSLDNVIAIAAAAKDSVLLLVIGLGISVPLIIAGAAVVMSLLTRFPILVWAGAALLGWIAGELIGTDPAVRAFVGDHVGGAALHSFALLMGILGILIVVGTGWWLRRRHFARSERGVTGQA
jgi:YjbE family integral membrane protein